MDAANIDSNDDGHRYGNFHNYYTFHPAAERLKYLPATFFDSFQADESQKFLILDIGCNDGTLTYELHKEIKFKRPDLSCKVLGIDLDNKLIKNAQQRYENEHDMTFLCIDILKNINDHKSNDKSLYIPNEIQQYLSQHTSTSFQLVTLFSITMWVHLNYGDLGLQYFLHLSSQFTSQGLLIEPQIWKSYKTAAKRCRKLGISEFPYKHSTLLYKCPEQDIMNIIIKECHMQVETLGTEVWGRPLLYCIHSKNTAQNQTTIDDKKSQISDIPTVMNFSSQDVQKTIISSDDINTKHKRDEKEEDDNESADDKIKQRRIEQNTKITTTTTTTES